MASTIINMCDSGSIMMACVYFYFVEHKTNTVLRFMWYLGTAASCIYPFVIPESPRWLFMKDPNS